MRTTKNRNPYDVLGVAKGATKAVVKTAFRKLAREFHPDSDPDNPWLEEKFKEVSAAYEKLAKVGASGKKSAARSDRNNQDAKPAKSKSTRPNAEKPDAQAASEDVYEKFKRRRSGPRIKMRGSDVAYSLKVSFPDAAKGCTKFVTVTNGKRFQVKVPPGTKDGDILRLKGQGLPGLGGKDAGDAKVEVLVDPHPDLKFDGRDAHIEVPITLPEAVLGGRIHVQTLNGKVAATVPPGSNTGTVLRLKGLGLARDDARGDQYVTLRVVLPKIQDEKLKKFIKDWAPNNAYKVRGD